MTTKTPPKGYHTLMDVKDQFYGDRAGDSRDAYAGYVLANA